MKEEFATPMMQQYEGLKKEYGDCILLFRLGDFYEMFMDDARCGAEILNITLTSRDRGMDGRIPMAGIPYHALDAYLYKLVSAGKKVAICEQIPNAKSPKLMDRIVTRIVTPGTVLSENALNKKENNYIASLEIAEKSFGFALADLSTGLFQTEEYGIEHLEKVIFNEFAKYSVTECILSPTKYADTTVIKALKTHRHLNVYPFADWNSFSENAKEHLTKHFKVLDLASFGIAEKETAQKAAAGLLGYLKYTQKDKVKHIKTLSKAENGDYMGLDRATIINLELFSTIRENLKKGSLLNTLDQTATPMGGRLLKNWLIKPLINKNEIENRYDAIEEFLEKREKRKETLEILSKVGDVERLLARLSVGIGNPRDVINLKNSLENIWEVYKKIKAFKSVTALKPLEKYLTEVSPLISKITKTINEEPPIDPKNGGFIKEGNHVSLDKLKKTVKNSKSFIADLEAKERAKTGINSLKIKFNQVFGYYIEITKSNLTNIPESYFRKQTLVNAERFITPELKEHEEIILSAEEKTKEIEYEIFVKLVGEIVESTGVIQGLAQKVAEVDCLINFAQIAEEKNYVRPQIIDSGEIEIIGGRHPVVESLLAEKDFVPNDVLLNQKERQLLIITGPNMAGKSVYIRQTALIVLMAQIGCFVPAQKAQISLVDNIFVRSGASDIITSGLSTFMVEMVETANILNNATSKSLIVMDEIGRGTSTYDGISIAWAVAEYLVENPKTSAKTLFATHYHELQKLEEKHPQKIKNYHFFALEENGNPVFLHKVKLGGADHSFGIAVAKLAGVPKEVCEKAKETLQLLEKNGNGKKHLGEKQKISELEKKLQQIDISKTTPLEALNILAELKKHE